MKYIYFVSYTFIYNDTPRFGNCDIKTNIPITNIYDVRNTEKGIKENRPDLQNLVILNYQLLRTEK